MPGGLRSTAFLVLARGQGGLPDDSRYSAKHSAGSRALTRSGKPDGRFIGASSRICLFMRARRDSTLYRTACRRLPADRTQVSALTDKQALTF
ncbi:hypothetical protein CONLIGDRAFT_440717 [Coniochaeta ligniaria NRRL 30616]|uniref:Uncharacterized protein n=1 Tax=Coniochaeta ligniaria NRRL 30616 TaxID=1408157 RepID=A0A1J7IJN6_9PEZI|nr:hypothetical protein CONLIGDRAFT_440717 [Coniochaeta ligniaria NRRL 30616]